MSYETKIDNNFYLNLTGFNELTFKHFIYQIKKIPIIIKRYLS